MKAYLVPLLVMGGLCVLAAESHGATLVYGFDFDAVSGDNIVLNNLGNGTATINNRGSSNSYGQGPVGDASGHSTNIIQKDFSIKDSGGIGLTTTTGVTPGMHIYFGNANSSWTDVLTVGIGGESIRIERSGNGGGFALYDTAGSPTGLHYQEPVPNGSYPAENSWFHMAVVIQDNLWTFYISTLSNGTWTTAEVGTATASSSFTGNLDWLEPGGTNANGASYMDNFAAYDGVLSQDEINYLAGNPIETEFPLIPEPATATLSLFELGALCTQAQEVGKPPACRHDSRRAYGPPFLFIQALPYPWRRRV